MRFEINKYQRFVLLLAAAAILLIQIAQFEDRGVRGYGWIFTFLVVGVLLFVGLSTKKRATTVLKSNASEIQLPNKEELKVAHDALREGAEVLAVEIEKNAQMFASQLIHERDEWREGRSFSVQGKVDLGDKLFEQMNFHIEECCLNLMLGLVGMRRSKGNKMYVTGIEYKTMQEIISRKIITIEIAANKSIPGPHVEINKESLSNTIKDNNQKIRNFIVQYALNLKVKSQEPESSLIDWFENESGMKIRGHQEIGQILSQDGACE